MWWPWWGFLATRCKGAVQVLVIIVRPKAYGLIPRVKIISCDVAVLCH